MYKLFIAWQAWLLATCYCFPADKTGAKPTEPAWEGQPLSYWLEGLGKWDQRASQAGKAVKQMGVTAMPFILQFACTNANGTTNQSNTGRAVYRACRLLDEGKSDRAVEKALRKGLKSPDAQIRMNAIAGIPASDKFKGDLEKLTEDSSLQVRQAATNALTHLQRYEDWQKKNKTAPTSPPLPVQTSPKRRP
jgi:hypothetical protein